MKAALANGVEAFGFSKRIGFGLQVAFRELLRVQCLASAFFCKPPFALLPPACYLPLFILDPGYKDRYLKLPKAFQTLVIPSSTQGRTTDAIPCF